MMQLMGYMIDLQIPVIIVAIIISGYSGFISRLLPVGTIRKYFVVTASDKSIHHNLHILSSMFSLWFFLALSAGLFEYSSLDDDIIKHASQASMYLLFVVLLYYLYSTYRKIGFLTFFVLFTLILSFSISTFDKSGMIMKVLSGYNITIHGHIITLYTAIEELILICVAIWLVRTISYASRSYLSSLYKIESNTRELMSKIVEVIVYLIAAFTIMNSLGINLTSLTVISGAVGVGIGVGLQKISANFISGVALLMEKTIKVGDLLELPGGTLGTVKHLAARYTLVEGLDGKEIIIPNADLATNNIINLTHTNHSYRIAINLTITYESDVKKALEIMLKSAQSHLKFLPNLPANCYISEFRDEGVQLTINFWIPNILDGLEQIRSEVMLMILSDFKKHNVKFADAHKYNFQ